VRYGNVDLKIEQDTLTITKAKSTLVRHYPGTDKSDSIPLGRPSTRITCILIAESDEERILLEQLLHSDSEREFHFHNFYYKRVITGETFSPTPNKIPQLGVKMAWYIPAEFIALDPVPYDTVTGEALY
jgi:hypothetical protein